MSTELRTIERRDGTTVAGQLWSDATAPEIEVKSTRWPYRADHRPATSRDLGLPKGGATYHWFVTDDQAYMRVASPKVDPSRLIEIA